MNRKEKLVTGEYYHIYNRGVEKRRIFLGQNDYQRFEDILFHYILTDEKFTTNRERTAEELRKLKSRLSEATSEETSEEKGNDTRLQDNIYRGRLGDIGDTTRSFQSPVAILAYVLMLNHFHLLLKQLIDKGITNYLHRIATSFTNYFNKKNERVGPLFQGAFKYKRVESEEQLIYLSKYIHRNPFESHRTKIATADDLLNYRWSSLPDYLAGDDSGLLSKDPILGNFSSPEKYRQFVLEDYDEKQAAAIDVLRLD